MPGAGRSVQAPARKHKPSSLKLAGGVQQTQVQALPARTVQRTVGCAALLVTCSGSRFACLPTRITPLKALHAHEPQAHNSRAGPLGSCMA